MKRIRKAVIPVAGLGTRFLPATKAIPKEMLPVVDRPVVDSTVVDEAREAGIEHFVFVTGRNKGAIEDHFDMAVRARGHACRRAARPAELRGSAAALPQAGQTSFTRQQAPLGLGHAVWCAREIVGDEPFAVILPDMLIKARLPEPDDRRLREAWRQRHRGRGGAGRRDAQIRRRRDRRGFGNLRDHRNGREAARGETLRRTSSSPAATSCSRKSSTSCRTRSAAQATRSS
jgi:hypothetical protein